MKAGCARRSQLSVSESELSSLYSTLSLTVSVDRDEDEVMKNAE